MDWNTKYNSISADPGLRWSEANRGHKRQYCCRFMRLASPEIKLTIGIMYTKLNLPNTPCG
jgi:hypothetical protein